MKYYSRLDQYKASNVKFDCQTQTAWSYGWWCFYKDGVFNNTFYSMSTNRHQSKVLGLLNDLGQTPKVILYHVSSSLTDIQEALKAEIFQTKRLKGIVQLKLDKLNKKDGARGIGYQNEIDSYSIRIKALEDFKKEREQC